jgi:hypothetical protein
VGAQYLQPMALTEIKGFIILARQTPRLTQRPHAVRTGAILTLMALYPQPLRHYPTVE